jgi:uncharacterized protein (TIGR02271 family)
MNQSISVDRMLEMRGRPVYASDGDKIGKIEDVYYDESSGAPEWVGVGTGIFGTKHVLVPMEQAEVREDCLWVPYPKDKVKNAPDFDEDVLSSDHETELFEYYGLRQAMERAEQRTPPSGTTPDSRTDTYREREGDLTLHEEQLRLGKRDVEAGEVRLRKWTETRPVQEQVELRRETAHVERQPINQPVSGADFSEQEIDIPLRAEEPVVQKDVVARERVSVEKNVETDRRSISGEVREEHAEVEGADEYRRDRRD